MWFHAAGEPLPLLGRCQESGPCHVVDEDFPLQCILFGNRGSPSKHRCPLVRLFPSVSNERVGETIKNKYILFLYKKNIHFTHPGGKQHIIYRFYSAKSHKAMESRLLVWGFKSLHRFAISPI